jgi:excisionase family DNA binding protein
MDQLLALIVQAIAEKVAPAIVEETAKQVARARGLAVVEALPPAQLPAPNPSTPPTREVLTTQEAAALLGVHPKSLERMRAQGKGPKYVRIGNRVRYRRSDLG